MQGYLVYSLSIDEVAAHFYSKPVLALMNATVSQAGFVPLRMRLSNSTKRATRFGRLLDSLHGAYARSGKARSVSDSIARLDWLV
jgi:hypothetical protein